MPPKKPAKKGKKTKFAEIKLPQLDKTFYELEIADLNRKLARLRSEHIILTETNTGLQTKLENRDVDAADIIDHLKRVAETAVKELEDHKVKLNALQTAKDEEAADCKKRMDQADSDYKLMHQHLSNDKKLLAGKLNNLEEFRIVRDELMRKFANQEKLIEERDKQYQRTMYELERLHILAKDRLKTEMEQRLYQLSNDFKRTAEMCIADTTKRVIRENIYINNEMTLMIETQRRLESENKNFRERDTRLAVELLMEGEAKERLFRCKRIGEGVIKKLDARHEKLCMALNEAQSLANDAREAREQVRQYKLNAENAEKKVRLLEQNLHAAVCERSLLLQEAGTWMDEQSQLREALRHARHSARAAMAAYKRGATDMLTRLAMIVCMLDPLRALPAKRAPSLDTVPSLGLIYKKDISAFIPMSQTCKEIAVQEIRREQSGSSISSKVSKDFILKLEQQIKQKEAPSVAEEIKSEQSVAASSLMPDKSSSESEEATELSESYYSVDFAADPDMESDQSLTKSDYLDDELRDMVSTASSITVTEEATIEDVAEEEEQLEKPEDESNP